jgi:hypothetical protein
MPVLSRRGRRLRLRLPRSTQAGNVFIADVGSSRVVKVAAGTGEVTTAASVTGLVGIDH